MSIKIKNIIDKITDNEIFFKKISDCFSISSIILFSSKLSFFNIYVIYFLI